MVVMTNVTTILTSESGLTDGRSELYMRGLTYSARDGLGLNWYPAL